MIVLPEIASRLESATALPEIGRNRRATVSVWSREIDSKPVLVIEAQAAAVMPVVEIGLAIEASPAAGDPATPAHSAAEVGSVVTARVPAVHADPRAWVDRVGAVRVEAVDAVDDVPTRTKKEEL